jgi:uncharacterized iron-regulated membrane protein
MEQTFRQSMNWLHTWSGVVVGGLLFAVFWTGTLVVFNKEIDRWMAPATRLAMPDAPISLDAQRATYPEAVAARAPNWNLILPNDRAPAVRTAWRGPTGIVSRYSDPRTGNELADDGTLAGTGFLYPFHYQLNIRFMNLGVWLVGIAGMAMLVLCVSGVIVHRKIFVDFFTFRPNRKVQRAVLDLHNVAGVLGLPFHFVIALSGVIVFFVHYFPSGNLRAFTQETLQSFSRPKLNKPGELASLDAMADLVRRRWPKQELRTLTVVHPGDAAAYVQITLWEPDNVTHAVGAAFFDGTTGALLGWRLELEPVMTAFRFILGLHVV